MGFYTTGIIMVDCYDRWQVDKKMIQYNYNLGISIPTREHRAAEWKCPLGLQLRETKSTWWHGRFPDQLYNLGISIPTREHRTAEWKCPLSLQFNSRFEYLGVAIQKKLSQGGRRNCLYKPEKGSGNQLVNWSRSEETPRASPLTVSQLISRPLMR